MRQDRVEARRLREELLNYFLTVRSRFAPTDPAQEILEQRISDIREILNDTNPNQLQVVPAPDPVPKIGSASYPDICVICQESVVGEGCRVNCPAAHIYHCECINGWRNSRATDTYFDTDWHDECPLCAASLGQGARFGVGGMASKFGREGSLLAIAMAAQAHEIFFHHCPTFGLGDDVPALDCIPMAAGDARVKASHDVGDDVSGDVSFGGHGDSPVGLLAL